MFPPGMPTLASFRNTALEPLGGWNSGHKITTVKIEDGQGVAYEDFITGFLNKETNTAWGRPVDVLFLKDGSLLISDDLTGSIYRVTYTGS